MSSSKSFIDWYNFLWVFLFSTTSRSPVPPSPQFLLLTHYHFSLLSVSLSLKLPLALGTRTADRQAGSPPTDQSQVMVCNSGMRISDAPGKHFLVLADCLHECKALRSLPWHILQDLCRKSKTFTPASDFRMLSLCVAPFRNQKHLPISIFMPIFYTYVFSKCFIFSLM